MLRSILIEGYKTLPCTGYQHARAVWGDQQLTFCSPHEKVIAYPHEEATVYHSSRRGLTINIVQLPIRTKRQPAIIDPGGPENYAAPLFSM